MGMFRWMKGGQVWFYELCVIERDGPSMLMWVKHFFPKLVGWEAQDRAYEFLLVRLTDGEAVFFELDRPNPRWLIYRLERPDRLVYFFTWRDTVDTETGTFEFTRQWPTRGAEVTSG